MRESEMRTALLISGEGTNAHAVIQACNEGNMGRIRPVVVISSRPDAPGLLRAEALGVPTAVEHDNVKSVLAAFGDGMVPEAAFDETPFQTNLLQAAKERAIQLFPKG